MPYEAYAEILKQGNLVAFPTETVYGLGASAWNPAAIRKIFEIKGRPADNPLIVHVSSVDMVKEFTDDISPRALLLMQKFWPGPLTLVFKKKPEVLDVISAGLQTVAIRMPDHPLALQLIHQTGPLVAPSANKSGRPSPTRVEHVIADFGKRVPVLDGGECRIGLESTVLDVTQNPPVILRPGYVTEKSIYDLCGFRPVHYVGASDQPEEKVSSPGMKYSHYAPNAQVLWLGETRNVDKSRTLFLMHQQRKEPCYDCKVIHFQGNYERMARELYDWFRKADHENLSTIVIEPFPEETRSKNEIIYALENRITKAVSKK